MSETEELQLLAFLDVIKIGNRPAVRGGVLVTDLETKPYEFRCTGPVMPTKLQHILYGDTLNSYIFVDLIGRPLLKAANEKPVLVLVQQEILLQVRPTVAYPIVLLQKTQSRPVENSKISMRVHSDFSDELDTAHALLDSLIEKRDFFEPFQRLQTALEEAHSQGIGNK